VKTERIERVKKGETQRKGNERIGQIGHLKKGRVGTSSNTKKRGSIYINPEKCPRLLPVEKNILPRAVFAVFAVPKKEGKGYKSNTHKKGQKQRKNSDKLET
jgi:hypothetical protein